MEIPKVIRAGSVDGYRTLDYKQTRKREEFSNLRVSEKQDREANEEKNRQPPRVVESSETNASIVYEKEHLSYVRSLESKVAELEDKISNFENDKKKAIEFIEIERKKAEAEGYMQGLANAKIELDRSHAELRSVADKVLGSVDGAWINIEAIAVEVAFESLLKLLGQKYVDDEFFLAVIKTVSTRLREELPIVLHVAKPDLLRAKSHLDDLRGYFGEQIRIIEDDRISMGGCMLETNIGCLDGRLDSQLKILRDALSSAL